MRKAVSTLTINAQRMPVLANVRFLCSRGCAGTLALVGQCLRSAASIAKRTGSVRSAPAALREQTRVRQVRIASS